MISEFGAEANRDGPEEERGTYAFQRDFIHYHLGVYATQAVALGRDLLGAAGVPRASRLGRRQPARAAADPPEGRRHVRRREKPAFADLQQAFRATTQFGVAARSRALSARAAARRAECSLP